jgi:DNA polymerase III delta subunit
MLIVIYGEDTYRSREWLHELVLKFKEKFDPQGYNVNSFIRNSELVELRSAVSSPPFLGTKRMVVCERLFETLGKNENVEILFTHIPESTIFIVWEEGDEQTFTKIPLFAKYRSRGTGLVAAF